MATIALPLRGNALSGSALAVGLALGVVGLFLSWFGAAWDVSWHRALGRETFWSPPHLFLYGGVTCWGLASLVATVTAMAGRPARSAELRVGPLHAELGLALVGLGALAVIGSAPFDELWHRTFGRDVDIWSPPHLTAVVGTALAFVGWATAFAPGVFPIGERLRRSLRVLMLGNLIGVFVFGMNFYYFMTVTREALVYPLLVTATAPIALALGVVFVRGRWAATAVAGVYTVFAVVTYAVLDEAGWRPPAFPPLVLGGALALDLFRARGGRWAHPVALGAAFSLAFVAAETLRVGFIAPPAAPIVSGPGVDPRLSSLFFQYYAQTVARPWLSLWPAAAAVLGIPLAATSWRFGRAVGAVLADDGHAEAFAHT